MRKCVLMPSAFLLLLLVFGSEMVLSRAKPAEITVVSKGVFSLNEGGSTDLTDRGILLHLSRINRDRDDKVTGVVFTLNGGGGAYSVGTRVDLKHGRATRDFVKDLGLCVLDLVSAVAPRGAPASATFRLMCE